MIFYKSKAQDGRTVITGTQADARAVNKQFEQIDIPTDKAGLMAFAQRWADEEFELNKLIDEMRAQLSRLIAGEPEGSTPSLPQPEPEPVDNIMSYGAARLAPVAEQVVERIGELGEAAFEALEGHLNTSGVGGSFSRGVHILSVICTSEHQLTRMLFRARKG